jgi:rhodanese-related sulfurtransferase
MTVAELHPRPLASTFLVDLRSNSEFAAGHIPAAVNIPMDQIEARLDDLNLNLPIVLICQTGNRAHMTAVLLEPCQRQITVLEGGTKAWIDAGLLVLTATVLALAADPRWVLLCGFVGFGLSFAGLTDICAMAMILEKLPWNLRTHCGIGVPHAERSLPNR